MKPKAKAIVVLSGGMDSTTVLYHALKKEGNVIALSFNYGQRHKIELMKAQATCKKLGIFHKVVDITEINSLMQGSALTSDIDVPEGHYEDENMKLTVVPNRNMTFISLATAYAVSLKIGKIYMGVHAGDHAIYPDCRAEFIEAMNEATKIANYVAVEILVPYLHLTKAGIVTMGSELGVDYSLTHTCYKGEDKACGKCGSCTERLEAFEINKIKDPAVYKSSI